MNFGKVQVQLRIRSWIRIHNLGFRIRILQKVSDPCGSGSTTLLYVSINVQTYVNCLVYHKK
jgi:hypothetical protein